MIWDDFITNNDCLAAVRKEGTYGIINHRGELLIEYSYDEVQTFPYTYSYFKGFITRKDGKYGIVDKYGKEAIPPRFDMILMTSKKGYFKVGYRGQFTEYVYLANTADFE